MGHPVLTIIWDTEFNRAWFLACQYWPPAPSSWIDRCQQTGWPVESVLSEIISQGCHSMP